MHKKIPDSYSKREGGNPGNSGLSTYMVADYIEKNSQRGSLRVLDLVPYGSQTWPVELGGDFSHAAEYSVLQDSPRQKVVRESNLCDLHSFLYA